MNYTSEQIQEFVKCADPVTGAIYFMDHFFNIQHPTKGKMIYHPFEYQKELINTYHNYRFSISLMPRQTGKALSIDTPILTPTGFKSLEEIKVGDTVYGQNGIKTQVTMATEIMYEHDCYKVTFDNGDTIIADSDHLWQVSCSNWRKDYKILITSDIISYLDKSNKPYIVINHPIDNLDQSLPVDPYLLGVWLGDGGTRDPRITTHVNDLQNYIDNNIVEKICEYSKKFDTIRTFTIPGGRKTLTKNGLYGNKHIPEIYFTASYNQRLSLLQGLMDTDGSIDKRGGRCEFYQKNLKLIDQVRTLLSTLGIKSRKHFKIINNEKYWTVGFKTDLPVFRLERKLKYIQKNKHPKNKRIYIYSIEKVDSVPVKCIQVDNNDHLFLAGKSLIPTHNSTSAAGYLLWYGMFKPDSTILIAAHKYSGAQEIMQRIRYAYEMCPDHIRAGVTSYNKGSIEFDNGSRIVAQATTENTGRGMSITLLYCLDGKTTDITVRNKETGEIETVTMEEFYNKIDK